MNRAEAAEWALDEWDEVGEVPAVEPLPRQSRIAKWVVWSAFLVMTVLVVLAGWIGWWYLDRTRPDTELGAPVEFIVDDTDTLQSLATRLEVQGFVADAEVFVWYVERQGGLEPVEGYYQIRRGDHMGNVLARLRTPPDQTYQRVTFPEGFTVAQMGERLAEEQPRLTADAFLRAADNPSIRSELRPDGVTSLEGLLFPDTYQVSNADNEAQIVQRMLGLMERVSDQEDLVEGAKRLGRSPYEILAIASMIEEEAKLDEDRPKIARVIYNRLSVGMRLQIDATVYYQQDRSVPFPELRQNDTPWNTYLRDGLPPTPISNPGRASIRAALNPAPNPSAGDPLCQQLEDPTEGCIYLYYVLADDAGGHAFAVTPEQHQANVDRAAAAGLLD